MSKSDYLKKYMGEGKKKAKKSAGDVNNGLKIIDDEVDWRSLKTKSKSANPAKISAASAKAAPIDVEDDAEIEAKVGFVRVQPDDGSGWVEVAGPTVKHEPDLSPKRRNDSPSPRRKASGDLSPPRRRTSDSPMRRPRDRDSPPPRRKSATVKAEKDLSPPRAKGVKQDKDLSPVRSHKDSPRRKRVSPSPKRRRQDSPVAAKDKRHTSGRESPKQSPKRKRNDSASPARRHDSASPKRRHDSSSPRRRDASPRKRSSDRSQPKEKPDLSPPRKEIEKKSGLRDAKEFASEARATLEQQRAKLATMSAEDSGQHAETVVRDKTGKKLTQLEKAKRSADGKFVESDEQGMEWGTGLAQKKSREERAKELQEEKNAPFSRYKDDARLNAMQASRDRWGDPMLSMVKKSNEDTTGQVKKRDADSVVNKRPRYRGDPWINRFGIAPGYRWDGFDRGTGWEQKMFLKHNTAKVREEEAYKWSSEDM